MTADSELLVICCHPYEERNDNWYRPLMSDINHKYMWCKATGNIEFLIEDLCSVYDGSDNGLLITNRYQMFI